MWAVFHGSSAATACNYGLDGLRNMVEQVLGYSLDIDNVCSLLELGTFGITAVGSSSLVEDAR